MKRVVVTGFGALSPIGHDWATVGSRLRAGQSGIKVIPEWAGFKGLHTRVGAPAEDFVLPPERYNRKTTRSMGRVALMGTRASELALIDAGLAGNPVLTSGDTGVWRTGPPPALPRPRRTSAPCC